MPTLLHSFRDTAALLFMDQELAIVRQAMMERLVAGQGAGQEEWQALETAVYNAYRTKFFPDDMSAAFEAAGCPPSDGHGTLTVDLGVYAVVGTHRLIKDIPVIGDPALGS